MPAKVRKTGSGYKCYSHKGKGGRPLSKKSKSKAGAARQCRAVNASLHRKGKI